MEEVALCGNVGGFSPEFGLVDFQKQRKDIVHGTIPFNFSTTITEHRLDTDDMTGRSTMDVGVDFVAVEGKRYTFTTTETLNADMSVIRNLSVANYPRDAAELTPKIIDGFVKEETTKLEDLTNARDREIIRSKLSIARISSAAGFFTGASCAVTVVAVAEGNYSLATITGIWSIMGGCVIGAGVMSRDEKVEFNKCRKNNEAIEETVERKTILKFIQSASRRQQIKNV